MADVFRLEGSLTLAEVGRHLDEGRNRLGKGDLTVDLQGVTEADSAALALLLDWCRTARRTGNKLVVAGLPTGMTSLADLYGVSDLLPIEA